MKLFHTLLYPLLGLLSLSSCSDDEQEAGNNPVLNSGAITFSVDLTGFVTRVAENGTSWTNGDKIGTYVLNADTSEPASETANVPYVCAEDGQSVAFTSETPLTVQDDGTPVKFVAYYPYNADMQDASYPVTVADQSNGSTACDLLYGTTSEPYVYDKEGSTDVALKFTHRLSKVILKFMDMDKNPLTVSDVKITGMPTSASFNVQTGVLTTDEASTADITPYVNAATDYREAIILPTALSDAYKVSFVLDGRTHEWVFADLDISLPKFNAGSQYTFGIYIDPTADIIVGRLENVDAGNNSAPWDDGSKEDGTAEERIPADYNLFPANGAINAFADTELKITFDGVAPELGTSGYIRIYRKSDHKMVDEINMGERREAFPTDKEDTRPRYLNTWMDVIGVTPTGSSVSRRIVNYYAARVEGNSFIIKPHQQRLAFDTEYYVVIDKDAIVQEDFLGIYGRAWTFKTKAAPVVTGQDIKISHTDNNADFYTLQGAIDFCATHIDLNAPKIFQMDDGIYQEILYLRDQSNITIKGNANANDNTAVSIQYDNDNAYNSGTGKGTDFDQFAPIGTPVTSGGRSVMTIIGNSEKIRFENVTIENTCGRYQGFGEALYIDNKSAALINCRLIGYQDTLLPGGGYNWFYNCYIAGATDFIWGSGKVVLFEECELHAPTGTRAVMQARVNESDDYLGYVFDRCDFTVGKGYESTLIYQYAPDKLTFLNCTFADTYAQHFVGEDKPLVPETPTVTNGCKVYHCKTESGADFYGAITATVRETVLELTNEQFSDNYGSRDKIMSWNGNDPSWFQE
ncbi:pectinesterase family protein [uncultured Bacteroides sp.]|jgi:hypothetical protein|uniref:pectinesterase family protein n=1 Tax=uncultured Bacteroides sp. TaxID=162156 RepID=UPI00280B18D1|nr:pectinesterase family protein [uncultured Bacteroides sp.]